MKFDEEFFNLGYIDRLSYKDTFIHNLDPRVKVFVTLIFIITVVSFSKYEVIMLLPFFIFPAVLLTAGDVPLGFVVKRLLIVFPFAFFVGIFNPIFDRATALHLFGFPVSYGLISFVSIILRFTLTISILIILIATTSFSGVCYALKKFRVPELFINQLLFLYRYIFVLVEEAMRMVRAKELRSFGKKGTELKHFASLIGTLLIKTIERAERVYHAMLSRGFKGNMPYSRRKNKITVTDTVFTLASLLLLYFFRFHNISLILENLIKGIVKS